MEPLLYLIAGVFGLAVLLVVATAVVNFAQPVRRRPGIVVAKRLRVRGGGSMNASTDYYATFEDAEGERKEFGVSAREYGLIAEGDRGTLATRGSWFWGFERGR